MDGERTAARTDYVRLLRQVLARRWRLVLAIFVGVAIPVVAGALLLVPKTYEAKATIFIEDPKKGEAALLRDWMPSNDVPFQLAILRSRSLAEAVLANIPRESMEELLRRAMHRDYFLNAQNAIRRLLGQEIIVYSPQQRALAELQAARTRFIPLQSGEVEIYTLAYHPRVAVDLANTYVRVLQDRSRSSAQAEARATREFIENFLNQTKTTLRESEEALTKFQRERGAIRSSERSGLELAKLAQMENSLADIQASKEIAKVKWNFFKGGKDATGKPLAATARPDIQQLRERLAQLEEKLAALQQKYTEQHPLVMATEADIKEVRGSLGSTLQSAPDRAPATQTGLGPAQQAMLAKQMADQELEISSLEAKEQALKRRIASFSRELSDVSADEMERSTLVRAAETQRNLQNLLTERLSTARIQEQGEVRGLRVIDLATLPSTPNSSPVIKRILLGLLLGLGLGVGVAALLEHSNQPIETVDDTTHVTGLPILGWLPAVESGRPKSDRDREPLSFVETSTRRSLLTEGCRAIRTSLESHSRHRRLQTIMLASAGPGEGKSTVLLNLGWVFRELGRRLIVVDSDLRRPTLHRALRFPAQSGLAELLTATVSWDDVMRPIKEDFLFLPAGATKGINAGALLSTDKIRRFLDLVKDRADLVLFDSAPVLAVPDNLILASMVDGVILVVQAGRTQQRDLIRAKEQLEKAGAPLLGLVVNQVSPRETRAYYGAYGDYYGLRPDKSSRNARSSWWPWREKQNGTGHLT